MANRLFDQDSFQLVKRRVTLFADFTQVEAGTPVPVLQKWNYPTFGVGVGARTYTAAATAAALPTGAAYPLQYRAGAEGVLSIERTAVGLYTLKLQDNYQRLLGLSFFVAAAAGASTVAKLNENTTISNYTGAGVTGSVIGLAFLDFAGAAVDPIGEVRLQIELADATEP
jgi:hypothetical protein